MTFWLNNHNRCASMVLVLVLVFVTCFFNYTNGPFIGKLMANSTVSAILSDNDIDSFGGYPELKVPFYIYEIPELNWSNATLDGQPFSPPEPASKGAEGKHADDYFLLQAALKHPMRTFNPEHAKLFFVPTLLNEVLHLQAQYGLRRGEFCTDGKRKCFLIKDPYQLFVQVNRSLSESFWFQRSEGRDHFIVASHWQARMLWANLTAIHMCNTLIFEKEVPKAAKAFNRVRMTGFYIGRACLLQPKTTDFAMIASIPANKKQFEVRGNVCDWLSSSNFSVGVCGPGEQCPGTRNELN